jgi:hypothetical protein
MPWTDSSPLSYWEDFAIVRQARPSDVADLPYGGGALGRLLQGPWLGFGWDVQATLALLGFLVASAVLTARFFRWE